jgi:hypothetical protein
MTRRVKTRVAAVKPAVDDDKNHDPEGVGQNAEHILATYTQIIYHIVFATKNRERVLDNLPLSAGSTCGYSYCCPADNEEKNFP